LRGETFSRSSTQGDVKQNEIGDIYRELGVPDTEAAILGLATTEILPSSLAMTAMGGFITRFALKRAGREAIKGSGKIAKGVPKALNVVDDFRNVFRQINTKGQKEELGMLLRLWKLSQILIPERFCMLFVTPRF